MLRTVRHIRPRQALAQALHSVRGVGAPANLADPVRELRVEGVSVPFLSAPAHARYDGRLHVELLNRGVDFAPEIDWDYAGEGPLWSYQLHQLDYLRSASLTPGARGDLLLDWIERHRAGIGWDPHPLSLRTLCWTKLLLTPGALSLGPAERAVVYHSMARQIETLSRNLEIRLQANHLLSNLISVVWGGILFTGRRADVWLGRQKMLLRELREQILADGAHIERSPMYHSLLLENLLDLLNLTRAAPGRAAAPLVAEIEQCSARMLGALRLWLHPDDEIALFADSALGVAQPARELERYAAGLGVTAREPARAGVLERAGYVRLGSEPFCLIASVAGPMPSYQPGHAHCDALSFELSCGDERIVVDTGLCEYVPGPQRDRARSTRAHATLEVAGAEQAEIWAAHRIGGRPVVQLEEVTPGERLQASCVGWSTRDTLHRRVFQLRGGVLEITDTLKGRSRPVRLTLPLAVGLKPRLAGAGEARLALSSGRELRITLPSEVRWRIERAPYYPEFGRRLERACLVGEAEAFRSGCWRFAIEA